MRVTLVFNGLTSTAKKSSQKDWRIKRLHSNIFNCNLVICHNYIISFCIHKKRIQNPDRLLNTALTRGQISIESIYRAFVKLYCLYYWFWTCIYLQSKRSPLSHTWVKVFKNGPSKICGRQPLKKIEVIIVCPSRPYYIKFFTGCLPLISLGPLLNILTHIRPENKFTWQMLFESFRNEWVKTEEDWGKLLHHEFCIWINVIF